MDALVGLLVIAIILLVIWYMYFGLTSFTRVITVKDKFHKVNQVGSLTISQDWIYNDRRTETDYIVVDTNRKVYNVSNCLLCGFYIGSLGKYSSVHVGDRIRVKGYGGIFTGVAEIYSVKHV